MNAGIPSFSAAPYGWIWARMGLGKTTWASPSSVHNSPNGGHTPACPDGVCGCLTLFPSSEFWIFAVMHGD